MKSPFDQNPEQEVEQQYEQNLERNYPPSERAGIRASDQRAAYQAATLKLNAEKEAQSIRDNSIRLGIAQAVEARAIKADELAIKSSTAELAVKEWEAKRNEMALDQVPLMVAEIEKMRGPGGYLSTTNETAVRLKFPYAAFSKNATINKIWEDEGSLRRSLMATEAANSEIIAKEERTRNKETEERMIAEVAAQEAGAVPTKFIIGGKTFETSTKADAASLEKERNAEMASLEKERKLSVDQFAKARNARTRAGAMLESAQKANNQGLINAANDLIKAADDDINEWKARRDEAESALKVRVSSKTPAEGKQPQFTVGNPSGMSTSAAPAAPAPAAPAAPSAPAAPGGTTNPPMDKEDITSKAFEEAARRYPALGVRDSAENAAYIAAYRKMKESGMTEFFDNPEWPIELGEVLAEQNRWKRSDQPAGKPDSTMPATPAAPAASTEAKQFASEAEARKSGAKAGDIIILINPKTGKPGRARLD